MIVGLIVECCRYYLHNPGLGLEEKKCGWPGDSMSPLANCGRDQWFFISFFWYSLHRSRGETGRMANKDAVEIPNPNPQAVVTTTTFFSWALTNTVEYNP